MDSKRKWDLLSKEERSSVIKKIIIFFQEERGDEIGNIAAQELLDFFLQEVGEHIYSNTMAKNKKWFKERLDMMEIDFDLLMK